MSYPGYKNNPKVQRTGTDGLIISAPDTTLLIVIGFLVVIGLMAIFSAGAPKCIEEGTNPASFALKQFGYLIVGFLGLNFFTGLDYKKLSPYAIIFAWFVIGMLCIVQYTPLGITVNEAKRWMMIGPIQFQPSELTKPAAILLLANAFYKDFKLFDSRKYKYYVPIVVMIFLVLEQPNLSMAVLICLISILMYITAGGPIKAFLTICATGFVAGLIGIATQVIKPYQLNRIKIWLNPESDPLGAGYNIIQSLIAFASGGFWGMGFGNSKQKLAWLPEGHTDFIFAVIAEEWGFVGCVLIIGLFWTYIHRGLIISSRCDEMFGKLLAVGIAFAVGLQAIINMSVASSLIPATGVTLPFISYGGTSLIVTMCLSGVLLNISKKRIKRIKVYGATRPR